MFPDGFYYDGIFKNNEFVEGLVNCSMLAGKHYEGELKSGKSHGQGKMTFEDGRYFVGTFVEGIRSGKGLMVWPDGRRY